MLGQYLLPVFLLVAQPAKAPAPVPEGSAKIEVEINGIKLDVFTYRPKNYKDGPLLVVFHGTNRNADFYRDAAKSMGDRYGALIVAPLFDAKRFPNAAYQNGGIVKNGKVQPEDQWTGKMMPKLAGEIRKRESRPTMPYYLIGHSAGGQVLSRTTAFMPTGAVRIVAANPGAHVFPTRDLPFPYGFGSLPKEQSDDEALKRYLAQPLTIYVGTADLLNAQLPMSETAMKQGPTRYARGKNCFKMGQDLAKAKGWPFNWTLVEAADIGHDGKAMFNHKNSAQALFGNPDGPPKTAPAPAKGKRPEVGGLNSFIQSFAIPAIIRKTS